MRVWPVDVGHKIMNVLEHTPFLFPTLSPYFFSPVIFPLIKKNFHVMEQLLSTCACTLLQWNPDYPDPPLAMGVWMCPDN